MKKVVLAVIFLSCLVLEVKADVVMNIEYEGNLIKSENYIRKRYDNASLYQVSLFDNDVEIDRWLINNLIEKSGITDNKPFLFEAIVQKMIYQLTCPKCNIKIYVDGTFYDDQKVIDDLYEGIKPYDRNNRIDGNIYEINYLEPLSIYSPDPFYNYDILDYDVTFKRNYLDINIDKPGIYELEFFNILEEHDGYVYSKNNCYRPFKITVKVNANKKVFKVLGKTNYNYEFDIYDKKNNFIEHISINPENNEFYYPVGKDIILKESNGLLEDVKILASNEDEEIIIDLTNNYYDVEFITKLKPFYLEEKIVNSDIIIKDNNDNIIYECSNESNCHTKLKYGSYEIIDKVTNIAKMVEIENDQIINIERPVLNGFISNHKIISISIDGKNIIFDKKDNVYYTDYIYMDKTYNVEIDKEYQVTLSDQSKYVYLEGIGLFYQIEYYLEENKEENENPIEIKPVEEISKEDTIVIEHPNEEEITTNEVEINVPNTNAINIDGGNIIDKKKYYYLKYYNYAYLYKWV